MVFLSCRFLFVVSVLTWKTTISFSSVTKQSTGDPSLARERERQADVPIIFSCLRTWASNFFTCEAVLSNSSLRSASDACRLRICLWSFPANKRENIVGSRFHPLALFFLTKLQLFRIRISNGRKQLFLTTPTATSRINKQGAGRKFRNPANESPHR